MIIRHIGVRRPLNHRRLLPAVKIMQNLAGASDVFRPSSLFN